MPVPYCHICDKNPAEKEAYGQASLGEGDYCPICHRPVCRFHMARVRWRWRTTHQIASAMVCRECKNTYQHRTWDTYRRDWID